MNWKKTASACGLFLFAIFFAWVVVRANESWRVIDERTAAANRRNIDAAVAFADLCIADGRKRSDCWQACTQTEAWEACREQITSPRTRTGARR